MICSVYATWGDYLQSTDIITIFVFLKVNVKNWQISYKQSSGQSDIAW